MQKVFTAFFVSSDNKSDCTSDAQSLCGAALRTCFKFYIIKRLPIKFIDSLFILDVVGKQVLIVLQYHPN